MVLCVIINVGQGKNAVKKAYFPETKIFLLKQQGRDKNGKRNA